MSTLPSKTLLDLPFYLSGPSPCPYLPARVERKLFTRLDGQADAEINGALCRVGFRRSEDVVYRPACEGCEACVPVRLSISAFKPSRSLRRVAARNVGLNFDEKPLRSTPEMYGLFMEYEKARHGDGDMARMDEKDFDSMIQRNHASTRLFCLSDAQGALKGCMLADEVDDGFSAVYSFFETKEPRRSLGTALILDLIEKAREKGLSYVYLGYWIAESRKMSYKSRFEPLQRLGPDGWIDFPKEKDPCTRFRT